MGLWFPGAFAFLTRLVLRLPSRSWLRKAMTRRMVRLGCEAINRGDFEVGFCLYDPEVEATFAAGLATVGESGTRGPRTASATNARGAPIGRSFDSSPTR